MGVVVSNKYSCQREKLREFLSGRKDHPTADIIYTNLRRIFPNISLGTVYRNLSMLEKAGEILKISNGSGTEHYDYCTEPHYHLSCGVCGMISDVNIPVDANLITEAEKTSEAQINSQSTIFYGTCKKCIAKQIPVSTE